MTTEDYLRVANDMKTSGKPPAILNFGLEQTSMKEWEKSQEANREVKTKDHMVQINNSKLLIAKYAREQRLEWERNLKEKNLWTQA